MPIETPPQPRFHMWDRVCYRGSSQPMLYTVIAINWDRYQDDYEYRLMHPDQGIDESEEDYVHAYDKDEALYLVHRPGTAPIYQRPDGTPTTEAEGNIPLPIIEMRRSGVNLRAPDPQIESLKQDVTYLKELIRAIGTLCASKKKGE